MSTWFSNHDSKTEALIAQIQKRAENLYLTRQMLCAEAVVVTLNKALNGGLSDAQAVAVAAPFSIALGDSGCICGALSGAVLACGLFVGKDQPIHHRQRMRKGARQLHDVFKDTNGATCCRVLSQSVRHDQKAHFQKCAHLTAGATAMAATLILYHRPELVQCTENGFLNKNRYQNWCYENLKRNLKSIESQILNTFVRGIYLVGLSIENRIVNRKMKPKCTLGDEIE